jgi:pectate lyase-like protein
MTAIPDILQKVADNKLLTFDEERDLENWFQEVDQLKALFAEVWEDFATSTTIIKKGLDWFNVKDFGAAGDGIIDDTTSISDAIEAMNTAGRGVLYFPAGSYLCSSALTIITASALVLGDGSANVGTAYASKVFSTSATANLFEISAGFGVFQDMAITNSASSTPSAGAGVKVSGDANQRVDFSRVRFYGFYICIDITNAQGWTIKECAIYNPILNGVRIQSVLSGAGDGGWRIINSWFWSYSNYAAAAINVTQSGGLGVISNCAFNYFVSAITINCGSPAFGRVHIIGNIITNLTTGHGISIDGRSNINILGNEFDLNDTTGNNTGSCIYIANNSNANIAIEGNIFKGGVTPAAIALNTVTVTSARIVGNTFTGHTTLVSQTSVTGTVIIIEPATTVTAETSYGLSSAVGTSGYYAREDHTHGSPSLSSATPQDVASTAAAGSGTTPPKNDHVHKGVHSLAKSGDTALYGDVTVSAGTGITLTSSSQNIEIATTGGELLMEDGVTFPPVPLTTEDGTDWLYSG